MNIGVILAGGKGLRLNEKIPKQMILLGNKPIISWSVDTFHKINLIDKVIVVSEKSILDDMKKLFPPYDYPKLSCIEGGEERHNSSYNALISSKFDDDDIFLIHDAARPFVTEEIIINTINEARVSGACGVYVNTSDTIAIVNDFNIESIPDRKTVYSAQTPQGFKYSVIMKAHKNKNKSQVITDDISLGFNMGLNVSIIDGDYNNFKITTEQDLRFAEFLTGAKNVK
ncbi:MAG: 2-C-methyl-D-erythritol 4-phosphate cytidylyltransferase [Spirochaetes bacterium]|nr:2-C-methyl-D-erythritol 4-phosphate cytidylyltransferase [Spirochaetota bacterium]